VALTLVVIGVLALPGLVGWLIGPQIAEQVVELRDRLPEAVESARASLSGSAWGRSILEDIPELREYRPSAATVSRVTSLFSTTGAFLGGLFVILFIGVYLAADPGRYVRGAIRLFPKDRRRRVLEILRALVHVLRRWLAGRFASMLVVGVLSYVGLLIAGIPLALALALLAALLSFIPYVGPVLGAMPAILVALLDHPIKALWVILIFVVVQVLENYVITPLIEQHAVSVPPVFLIIAQILMAVLFGALGVLFATPITVVAIVAIEAFYIEDVLGDRTDLLGGRSG
jgi:predicted PurR-regulated permease PerM